jgi:DNA-binding PadR family transcriptional regulator
MYLKWDYHATKLMDSRSLPSITEAGFQILLALASGHSHGYAVMSFIDEATAGAVRLGPGTLYRTIARLLADGLVVEADGSDPSAPHDARRRYYELTASGREAAAAEAALLARLMRVATDAGLLPDTRE